MEHELPDLQGITILFDLDGTLVDSAPDLIHTLNITLTAHEIPPVDEDIARPLVSHGARNMILTGLKQAGRDLDEVFADQLLKEFLDYYSKHIAVYSRPFEDVTNVLECLAARGAALGVCTNKTQAMALQLLETLQLARYFEAVAGRDRFETCKPDPAHLLKTAGLMPVSPDQIIMVGDSSTDIETARAAKVPVIAATFGYETRPVQHYKPDAIFSHYRELPDIITSLVSGPVQNENVSSCSKPGK